MATLGDIRFQLSKQHPGVDHDLLDAWILDGYRFILGEMDWQRMDVKASIQIPAEYVTGTVALTKGSNAVTGTGTTFTSAMTGRLFRALDTSNAYYQFTFVDGTHGTLDRGYEGDTVATASYRITQNVYALPSDCRSVLAIDGLAARSRDEIPPSRFEHGPPGVWVQYIDSYTDPPAMQIEVYPLPVDAQLLAVTYTAEDVPSAFDEQVSLLPFVYPAAIKAYVSAQVALAAGNVAQNDQWMKACGVHIKQMRQVEANSEPSVELKPQVAAHRLVNRRGAGGRSRRFSR